MSEVNFGPQAELRAAIVTYLARFPELKPALSQVRFVYDKDLDSYIKFNGRIIRVGEKLLTRDYKEIFGVITHVLMHYLFNHIERFKNYQYSSKSTFSANLAMDVIANMATQAIKENHISSSFLQIHEGAVNLETIFPPHILKNINKSRINAEIVYQYIINNIEEIDMDSISSDILNNDLDADDDQSDDLTQEQKEANCKSVWEEVLRELSNKNAGSRLGDILRGIEDFIPQKTIDYKTQLKEFMIHHLEIKTLTSYNRLSRRSNVALTTPSIFSSIPILPGVIGEKGLRVAAVVIDTSGSITKTQLTELIANVIEVQQATNCKLHIIFADYDIQKEYELDRNDDVAHLILSGFITISGGGGTDFRPAQRRIVELNPDVGIYLTDGYGPYLDKDSFSLGHKFVWVLTLDNAWLSYNTLLSSAPSYGKFIQLDT